jgi:S-(hydroxymethyl)glutathione dehydrogenase/alcohol dehydrogenase
MRGAFFVGAKQDLSVEDAEAFEPSGREVIVRLEASGVCHSDLSVIDGNFPGPGPMLLGHEGAAIVEWIGPEVTRVRVGQRVILSLTPVCGVCWHCLRFETHLCELGGPLMGQPRARRRDGSIANAIMGLGTFADVATVHEASCVPIETDLPSEQLALIGCGVTTGLGAALNTARVGPGDTVAVIGCGGVGTSVIQGARIGGASRIFAIDPVALKRETALKLGATDAIDPTAGDPVDQLLALTNRRGVDHAFEVVGNTDLMTQAMKMTRRGGTTILVGVPNYTAELSVPALGLIISDRTIKGSYYGSSRATRDFPRFIDLIETGRLDLDAMITKRFDLEHVNDAFDAMRTGEAVRSVIV